MIKQNEDNNFCAKMHEVPSQKPFPCGTIPYKCCSTFVFIFSFQA